MCLASAAASVARARIAKKSCEPTEGQAGKDLVWVPTPPELVETMLDMAGVIPGDVVIDLGSGDGRIVIAAAKRGAQALGIEYDAGLVALARRNALHARVDNKVAFVQGDFYRADLRKATVLTLFLLPDNLKALQPLLQRLKPGTRVVSNRFAIDGWEPREQRRIGGHSESCCTALLYVTPEAQA